MELPLELQELIKEFSMPLTRPDWKYNFPIHRQAVYAENPLFGEELPDDAYGHEIYFDGHLKNVTEYEATYSAKALHLFFEIKSGMRIILGYDGDQVLCNTLSEKIINSALNSNPPFLK